MKCLKQWNKQEVPWRDIAVLSTSQWQGKEIAKQLDEENIPYLLADSKKHKNAYDPANNTVTISTIHSSKGLEFPRVIMLGVGSLKDDDDRKLANARLLYVGMTRAQECLLITTSESNEFSKKLMSARDDVAA